jgi:4-oxalocrotonate tautomerase
MPVVTVDWWSGFGEDERRRLVRSITDSVVDVTGCRPDSVTVILRDVQPDHWARGGVLGHERRTGTDAPA